MSMGIETGDGDTGPEWMRSSLCHNSGCVEVASFAGGVFVRDGKLGDASPVLTFDQGEWAAFSGGVALGDFDALAPPAKPQAETLF